MKAFFLVLNVNAIMKQPLPMVFIYRIPLMSQPFLNIIQIMVRLLLLKYLQP